MISLIAAMSDNRVIGANGALPWHLPDDLKFFMRTTRGHCVIMGRKTWQSMNGPLRDRTNIVITTQRDFTATGATIVHNLDEAMQQCPAGDEEIFIIGGGEIFKQTLPQANRLYLTIVHITIDGDARFPQFNEHDWRIVRQEPHQADERHEHAFTFRVYDRK